jgi:hypothetical protein
VDLVSTHVEEPPLSPSLLFQRPELTEAGWTPFAAVLAAGFTLGFFAWFGIVVPTHARGLVQLSLVLAPFIGAAVAAAVWFWYARYFSARTGIKLRRSLQYGALAWLPFVLLWLSFALPFWFTHGGTRLFLYCVGAFCIVHLALATRFNQTVRDVLVDFAVTRFAVIVIAELAAAVIGQRAGTHVEESRHILLAVWGHWDAVHYIDIATVGYHGTDMAFFPLYPILVAGLGMLVGNHLIAGLVISNVAFFFALLYLYKLVEHEFDRPVARRAIFYISVFPTAIFFSAVYTESLFLFLTVASFYYMRERRWWVAGVIGFFAALTRVEGLLLVVPFVIEWFTVNRRNLVPMLPSLLPIVWIPLGLACYMGYLWVLNGDPLYFSHVQIHWHRHLAAPWTSVIHSIRAIATAMQPQTVANQLLELAFTALMIAVLIAGFRRLRASYIAYMTLSILVPMSTSSLMSMPRFALVLFPMFVIFGLWGKRPSANNAIVAFSLPLLGLFTVLFADWYWVA